MARGRRGEPKWLTRRMLDVIHDAQLREHGGSPGIRDDNLLESALGRARHAFEYGDRPDLATIASAYAFGLVKNHGYVDGNKRAAFMAAYVFLGLNGLDVDAEETEVVAVMEGAAAGRVSESELAEWLRPRLRRIE